MEKLNFTDTVYRSAPGKISFFDRTFPEISLYARFLYIVFKASAKAKKNKYSDDQWCQSSMDCLRALETVGMDIEISGIQHLEQMKEPFVVIGNHMSLLETIVLPMIIRPFQRMTYIVKQSLLDYPVFGHIMHSRNPIAVSRTSPRRDLKAVIDGGKERLAMGVSVIVFPQTTRMPAFDSSQFSTIGVKLAQKANAPIVPLALKTDAWGNGKYLKDFGRIDPAKPVRFAFGKPIRVKGRGVETQKAIISFITEKLAYWNTEAYRETGLPVGESIRLY